MILAAMVNAKQSGIGLVAALAGAAIAAGWAERTAPRRTLIRSTLLAVVPAIDAYAHVGVSSPDAAPGAEAGKLVFRVPNESDSANTTEVT